ncbi:cadherin-like protein 26 isoform X2 [Triplophysa rosa]|uniref:cadherin-like protein 26 isoform X2 n=1 Tax=Triplophysa rosa TaxID=992332 RepID=UPI002545C6E3|nr:cadherin-like protein 26 isoform X2 [Triplophysa rosa]
MRILPVTFLQLLFAWTMHTWADMGRIRQKRTWIIDSYSIEEENPGPFPYKLGKIELDGNYRERVHFELGNMGSLENILIIDNNTATNKHNHSVVSRLGVEIKILDINDNPPIFDESNYEVTVEESHAQGEKVLVVSASDKDDSKAPNGTFSFTIKSVTPKTDNVEFYIQQNNQNGTIYFKGCLGYEKAQKYTILVEAKDHGEVKKLSSTSTVTVKISNKNNHLPEFSGQTGSGKVKERYIGTEVLRLQVTDKDSRGSKAWKAKYTIHGDRKNIFKIETDPNTNEGILTVVKPMDYEEQTYQSLSISVQNEAPYFSCTIEKRPHDSMWELNRFFETPGTSDPNLYKSIPVTIYVEDVNDPPVFIPPVKDVVVMENTDAGIYLTTITAVDLDEVHGNTIRYIKGEDVAGWITVDKETGNVSTAKILDRESPSVINSVYEAIVYAADDGSPPLTGTGTVRIHLQDLNDNVPLLTVGQVHMCLDKEPTTVNITAVDLDLPPYSSPFYYELLGDVEGKWRIDPAHGITVNLYKDSNVYSGHHSLQMRISDQQGISAIQNLSVTVCNCGRHSKCQRMVPSVRMGIGGTCGVLLAVLLLAAMLLLALLCRRETFKFPINYEGSSYLMKSNTEHEGTDCEVPFSVKSFQQSTSQARYPGKQTDARIQNSIYPDQLPLKSICTNSSMCSFREIRHFQRSNFISSSSYNSMSIKRKSLFILLNQRLLALQNSDEDHDAYKPHCYAQEGEFIANADLDAISITEMDFLPEMLNNLDCKYRDLASICRPDLIMKT